MQSHVIRQVVMQHSQGRRRLFLVIEGGAPVQMPMPGDGAHYPRIGDALVHDNGAYRVVPLAGAGAPADSGE